jgi:hypothetical protein
MTDLDRTLPLLWAAIGAGGLLAAVVLTLVAPDPPAMPDAADLAFYAAAVASLTATGAALMLIRSLDGGPNDDAAIRTRGVMALALAEMPAIVAGIAAFLTGNVLALAFVVPFLAFLALTWPSAERVARWRGDGRL